MGEGQDYPQHNRLIAGPHLPALEEKQVSVEALGKDIIDFLDPTNVCKRREPLVVLCFDEAHGLTITEETMGWSPYNILRHSLRHLRTQPMFAVFIGTASNFHQFSPSAFLDPSYRAAQWHDEMFPPLAETGYDQLAIPVIADGSWLLDDVATLEYMSHLGRPL